MCMKFFLFYYSDFGSGERKIQNSSNRFTIMRYSKNANIRVIIFSRNKRFILQNFKTQIQKSTKSSFTSQPKNNSVKLIVQEFLGRLLWTKRMSISISEQSFLVTIVSQKRILIRHPSYGVNRSFHNSLTSRCIPIHIIFQTPTWISHISVLWVINQFPISGILTIKHRPRAS